MQANQIKSQQTVEGMVRDLGTALYGKLEMANVLALQAQEHMVEQMQRLSDLTEACRNEIRQIRGARVEAISAVAAGRVMKQKVHDDISMLTHADDGGLEEVHEADNVAVAVSLKSQSAAFAGTPAPSTPRSAPLQGRRTVVVGSFGENTRRAEVEEVLKGLSASWEEKAYALFAPSKRGTIGFIRFRTSDSMWACMRARAGQPRPSYKGALL